MVFESKDVSLMLSERPLYNLSVLVCGDKKRRDESTTVIKSRKLTGSLKKSIFSILHNLLLIF